MKSNTKKKDDVDINTLPKINIVTTSVLLDFKNAEKRFKLLESIYKTSDKTLKLVTREQIIEYAKETKIYIDPEDGKKPNPKDPPIEKREINADELAKAASLLITDRSVPLRKDKKTLLDKIEELKKQKEEATVIWNTPPAEVKVKPKPGDKKKEPINPDDIVIPVVDEYETEMIVVLYNYPIEEKEYLSLSRENVILNNIFHYTDTEEIVEPPKEETTKKNVNTKEAKPTNEMAQMLKYFVNYGLDTKKIFTELKKVKYRSDKLSTVRFTLFDSYTNDANDINVDNMNIPFNFHEFFVNKMKGLCRNFLSYLNWASNLILEKFSPEVERYSYDKVSQLLSARFPELEYKNPENCSVGVMLYAFLIDLLKVQRKDNSPNWDVDEIFANVEKELENNFECKEDEVKMKVHSHLQNDLIEENSKIEQEMINCSNTLSTPFKLIVDENDLVLKSSLESKTNNEFLSKKEQTFNLFRNLPGFARDEGITPIEENRRKAMRCEVYPFLPEDIGVPLYEKFEVMSKFEQLISSEVPDHSFDFGDRIYIETMNEDVLKQTISNALMKDMEYKTFYNERSDNMLLLCYYKCPKGRVYRKTRVHRYLSKPDFENWVKYFHPTWVGEYNLYEADDVHLAQVKEKVKYMFPSDDGVFIKKVIENGIFSSYSNYVLKDHLMFGIRHEEFWCRNLNDALFTVSYNNGAYVTFTYPNGLIVQILPSGEICQKNSNNKDEEYRIVTSKASIIKQTFTNEKKLMYSNGNVCTIANNFAINVNNKGMRLGKNLLTGTETVFDPIPVTVQTDPESNTRSLIREDNVLQIRYPDLSQLTVHSDETKIYVYPTMEEKSRYLVEHKLYAPVDITYDAVKGRTKTIIADGSSDALLDTETRSYDGRITTIRLPDSTEVVVYKEMKKMENEETCLNTITLINCNDGTIVRVQQDGDIVVLTSEEKKKLNNMNENDYLFELNGKPSERRGGAYTAQLGRGVSKIWTKDHEHNVFEIHSDGTAKCLITGTTMEEMNVKSIEEIEPRSPDYSGIEYLDPDTKFCAPPSNFYPPRLFVIENDSTGYELLTEKQVSQFKATKAKNTHTQYMSQTVEKYFTSHYWITKYLPVEEQIAEINKINNIKIPKKLQNIQQTPHNPNYPVKEIYLYRNLIQASPIDEEFRTKVALALENKSSWFEKKKVEWSIGTYGKKSPEIQENVNVQRRILTEKQNKEVKFNYEDMKLNFLENYPLVYNYENESILFDIEEYIDLLERKKIIFDMQFRILPLNITHTKHEEIESLLKTNNPEMNLSLQLRKKAVLDLKTVENKFITSYFQSDKGKEFLKFNPQPEYKPRLDTEEEQTLDKRDYEVPEYTTEDNQDLNSPIVYLREEKKTTGEIKSKEGKKRLLPSLFKREKELTKLRDEKEAEDIKNKIALKSYKFTIDGKERTNNPLIPNYIKPTFPQAEFNEDYIYMEKLTDKRIKTTSTANRLYFNAPSVSQIRKSGQHHFLLNAMERKSTYDEMMERLNLMITSELCDPMNKVLKIDPVELDFGKVLNEKSYQMHIKIRNDDNLTNLVHIRTRSDDVDNKMNMDVEKFIGGKIVPGDIKKVKVILHLYDLEPGKYTNTLIIMTKSFIYKIPIKATVVNSIDEEQAVQGREIYKKEVRLFFKDI